MKCNVGQTERRIRVIGGLFLASLAFWGPANLWFLLGLVPVVTGLAGYCPAYTLVGVNAKGCCGGGGCHGNNATPTNKA